jgi:hypothetical protein
MKLVWVTCAWLSCLTVIVLSALPIDIESLGLKWSIIIVLILSVLRLIYYESKLFVLRAIAAVTIILILVYWRFELKLDRIWISQMMIYENRHTQRRTIELQTMETGEWPRQRIIERFSLLPFIYWKKEIDATSLKRDISTWRKVNKRIR